MDNASKARRAAVALFSAVGAVTLLATSWAPAQISGTWIAAAGSWSVASNWLNGAKSRAGGVATFGFDIAVAAASAVDPRSVDALIAAAQCEQCRCR